MSEIQHQPDQQRFVLNYNGETAVLEYSETDNNGVNFTRTFVPPEIRGGGRAKKLVDTGLAWARENDKEIEASCWFVAKFLK